MFSDGRAETPSMLQSDASETLAELLVRVLDSARGYEEAAGAAPDDQLSAPFRERANQRRANTAQLRERYAQLGIEVGNDAELLAIPDRKFKHISSVSDQDDAALHEVIDGSERWLLQAYDAALALPNLSASLADVIAAQRDDIREIVHDR
ncbi:MAG: DUF2383 domain-containing protein [Pseudomonadota bacterium]